MKKYILPIAIIAAVSLSSCRKERTCSCTTTTTTNGSGSSGSSKNTVGHATKREAKRLTPCHSFKTSDSQTNQGIVFLTETVADCKLD